MDEQRDFTYDLTTYNGLPDYVRQLKAGGKHYVIILVSFQYFKQAKPITINHELPGKIVNYRFIFRTPA